MQNTYIHICMLLISVYTYIHIHIYTRFKKTLCALTGRLWAAPLWDPLGTCAAWARVGPHGPLWAGPLWTSLGSCGPLWTLVGPSELLWVWPLWAGPLWAGPLWTPLGPLWVGPLWNPWALMDQALMGLQDLPQDTLRPMGITGYPHS